MQNIDQLFEDSIANVNEYVIQTTQLLDEIFFADLQSMYQELNAQDATLAGRFIATILPLLTDPEYKDRYSSTKLRRAIMRWLVSRSAKKPKYEFILPPAE
jgi:hypothetical protein